MIPRLLYHSPRPEGAHQRGARQHAQVLSFVADFAGTILGGAPQKGFSLICFDISRDCMGVLYETKENIDRMQRLRGLVEV